MVSIKSKIYLLLNIIVQSTLLPLIAFTQPQTANWYFGHGPAINWNTYPPQTSQQNIINTDYSSATISDRHGKLLFSTNGSLIFDSNNKAIPDFKLLDVPVLSNSNVVIIPMGTGKFYVFACDATLANNPKGSSLFYQNDSSLYYTEIPAINGVPDFSKPLTRKKLASSTFGGISAVFTPNNRSAWLITAKIPNFMVSNEVAFVAYRFSECGLEETKTSIVSQLDIGSIAGMKNGNCPRLKFSPNGHFIALSAGDAILYTQILNFDIQTGEVTYRLALNGIEIGRAPLLFSKDSRYFYYKVLYTTDSNAIRLIKYDLINRTKADSILLYQRKGNWYFNTGFTAAQHSNGSIFFARVIAEDPDFSQLYWSIFELIDNGHEFKIERKDFWSLTTSTSGLNTRFAWPFDTYFSFSNFTSFVESYFDPGYKALSIPSPEVSRVCAGDSSLLSLKDTNNQVLSYKWNLGDQTFISGPVAVKHLYKAPGKYQGNVILEYPCHHDTLFFSAYVDAKPELQLADISQCNNSPVTIKGPPGYISYKWQDGSTDTTYTTKNTDTGISLTVTNACGAASASCKVGQINVTGPNVFTPNGDGLNDYLIFDNPLEESPQVTVNNRWGKKVFSDNHYQNNWDAADLLPGVYYYELSYPGCSAFKSWLQIIK